MKKLTLITILISSLVWLTSFAFASPQEYEPEYYDNAKVVRVKYTQGETYITRSYDEGREEAAVNLPIFEKDSAGTTDGRLEIYLGRLNYLRLDQDSEVVFEQVPELRKTNFTLRIIRGGIYLDVENLDYERDIEIQTPDCGVFLLDKGTYRINVTENGKTEFFAINGIAEVAGENTSYNVKANQKIVMFNGQIKERPFYFYTSDYDDFDQWNLERRNNEGYSNYTSNRYLAEGYEDYEYEMSRNGNWRYEPLYSCYVWSPYVTGNDWRPYSNGRWVWNPYYGYVWTSYDTCGYFTHHYGRWHWDPISGWCWVPGYHWSPAWVSWFWDDDYYGWCPMSYWNRPIVIINNHWRRNYDHHQGIPIHGRSTTIIRKSQLSASHIGHAALKANDMETISKKSLVFKGKAPNDRLVLSKVHVIDAEGKSVIYKKEALLSSAKYKAVDSTEKGTTYKYTGSKLAKDRIAKYTPTDENRSTSIKTNAYKYKPIHSSDVQDSTGAVKTPNRYKPYKSSGDSGSDNHGGYRFNPHSSSPDRSPIKSSAGKRDSSSGSDKSSIKRKKDDYPTYSSYGSDYHNNTTTTTDTPEDNTSSYSPKVYKYNVPTSSYRERRDTSNTNTSSYSSSDHNSSSSIKEHSSSYSKPTYSKPAYSVPQYSHNSVSSGGGHSSIKNSTSHSSDSGSSGSSRPIKKKN